MPYGFLLLYAVRSGKCHLLYFGFKLFHMAFSTTTIKPLYLKLNKPNSYSIWYTFMCTFPTNFVYLPIKTLLLYTYVCQLQVISDLAVIPPMDPSPAPTTMANSTDLMTWRTSAYVMGSGIITIPPALTR